MTNCGGWPLVATSDATSWRLIVAESSGPNEGMSETGSQFATKTLPPPISRTATSTPGAGPTITARDLAPVKRQIVLAIVLGVGFPSCIVILQPANRQLKNFVLKDLLAATTRARARGIQTRSISVPKSKDANTNPLTIPDDPHGDCGQ